jgi:hypothetical protein
MYGNVQYQKFRMRGKKQMNYRINNALFPKKLSKAKLTQKAAHLLAPHGEEDKYRTHNRTSPPVCFKVIN